MCRKINFLPRVSLLLTLSMAFVLQACSVKDKLVTDTGSGKKQAVAKEEYLMQEEKGSDTKEDGDSRYTVLTLTEGTFVESALSQTLSFSVADVHTIRLESHAGTVQFGQYQVRDMDYVEVGDIIAVLEVETDKFAVEEARMNLARLQERYEQAQIELQEELEKMEEERKTIYNGYDNQIAQIQYRQRQLDGQNESYHYEQQIADTEKKLRELAENSETYEVKADKEGYVLFLSGYNSGAEMEEGDYICHIIGADQIFTNLDSQAEQFGYGKKAVFETRDGSRLAGVVVSGGPLALYGSLDSSQAVFRITSEDSDSQMNREMLSRLVIDADLKTIENVIVIPRQAVTVQDDEYYVTVMREDGSLIRTEFIPGGSNADEYWVLRGLSEGMQIVYR